MNNVNPIERNMELSQISSRNKRQKSKAQRYSMCEVSEIDDPTLAWVQALPSPSKKSPYNDNLFSRPDSRFLETPGPIDGWNDHTESKKQSILSSAKRRSVQNPQEKQPPGISLVQDVLLSTTRGSADKHNSEKEKRSFCKYKISDDAPKNSDPLNDVLATATKDAGLEELSTYFASSSETEDCHFSRSEEDIDFENWSLIQSLELPNAPSTFSDAEGSFQPSSEQSTLYSGQDGADVSGDVSNHTNNSQSKLLTNISDSSDANRGSFSDSFFLNCKEKNQTHDFIQINETNEENSISQTSRKRRLSQEQSLSLPEKRLANACAFNQNASMYGSSSTLALTPHSESTEEFKRAASVGSSICSSLTNDIAVAEKSRLPDEKLMSDIVRRYLRKRDEMKVVILHAKVAQKSYGTEKRFFCPPPCVHLLGGGWKTKQRRKAASSSNQSPLPSPSRLTSPMGVPFGASDVCVFMGVGGNGNDLQQIQLDPPHKNYAAAKTLHTPDSDKRKNFEIHVKMFYGDGTEIGLFHSQRIKVISKPSKKKQTVKNTELCIASGSKVALFNRLRSQTVSTRYLYVDKDGYKASASQWGAFAIHLLDEKHPESEVFEVEDGYIHYGTTVKLVCSVTGFALPRIVIRKVDKHMAMVDSDEPISQLHKCALYLKDTDRQYLCLSQERIVAYTASPSVKNPNMDQLSDGACWTIISTDKSEYSWSDSAFNLVNNVSVTPVPIVKHLEINGGGELAMVELTGENFSPNLTVWFADIEAETMFRCNECMVCMVPAVSKLQPTWKYVKKAVKVPLLLVREDGVIYPCGINFYYTPEPKPKKADKQLSIKKILKQKQYAIGQ